MARHCRPKTAWEKNLLGNSFFSFSFLTLVLSSSRPNLFPFASRGKGNQGTPPGTAGVCWPVGALSVAPGEQADVKRRGGASGVGYSVLPSMFFPLRCGQTLRLCIHCLPRCRKAHPMNWGGHLYLSRPAINILQDPGSDPSKGAQTHLPVGNGCSDPLSEISAQISVTRI
jgi:hypothetical protein